MGDIVEAVNEVILEKDINEKIIISDYSVYNKASAYTEIQGIEYLTVFESVDENAQDEGLTGRKSGRI